MYRFSTKYYRVNKKRSCAISDGVFLVCLVSSTKVYKPLLAIPSMNTECTVQTEKIYPALRQNRVTIAMKRTPHVRKEKSMRGSNPGPNLRP